MNKVPDLTEVLAEELRLSIAHVGRLQSKLEEIADERARLVANNQKVAEYVRLHQLEGLVRDEVVRVERRLIDLAKRLAEVL